MEARFLSGTFFIEVSQESLANHKVIDLHSECVSWKSKNNNAEINLPDENSQPEKSALPSTNSTNTSNKTNTHADLPSRGRSLFKGKVAEIEARLIQSGMVGNADDMDLDDSFVDDPQFSSDHVNYL